MQLPHGLSAAREHGPSAGKRLNHLRQLAKDGAYGAFSCGFGVSVLLNSLGVLKAEVLATYQTS
jgi:hypothetical protein